MSASFVRFCVLWLGLMPVLTWAQKVVILDGIELSATLSPPHIVGSTSCDNGRLRVSLTGGTLGNLYEVFELDQATGQPVTTLGLIQVGSDPSGITFDEVALNQSAPLIGAVQIDTSGNKARFLRHSR